MPRLGEKLVDIHFDEKKLKDIETQLKGIKNGMPRVMSQGINKVAMRARTRMTQLVASETQLKLKDIRRGIKVDRATYSEWAATVHVQGDKNRIPLFKFGGKKGSRKNIEILTTQKQAGWLFARKFEPKFGDEAIFSYRYRIKRKGNPDASYKIGDSPRKQIPQGAFVAKMESGHVGFFKANPNGVVRSITELMGPSVGGMIKRPERLDMIKKKTFEDLSEEIARQVEGVIKLHKAKAG